MPSDYLARDVSFDPPARPETDDAYDQMIEDELDAARELRMIAVAVKMPERP